MIIAAASVSAGALAFAWWTLDQSSVLPLSALLGATAFVCLMLGLRLPVALALALPAPVGYLLLGLGYELPAARFAYELACLAFVTIACAYACYRLEHAARTSFLEREIVSLLAGSDAL